METTNPSREKIPSFAKALHNVVLPTSLPFQPTSFNASARVTDINRFAQIAAGILNPQSQLNGEMIPYIDSLGGSTDPRFWRAYLPSYDRIVSFSDAYLNEAAAIDEILPKKGRFIEVGAGMGTLAAYVAWSEPERHVTAVDFEPESVAIAKARLGFMTNWDSRRYDAQKFDLTEDTLAANSLDGGFVHNVFYLLGSARKKGIDTLVTALKDGAYLIFVDVVPRPREKTQQGLLSIGTSAIKNGSPATEADFAIVGVGNNHVLFPLNEKLAPQLYSDDQQQKFLEAAGLEIVGVFESYGGLSRFYITKKIGAGQARLGSKSGPQ